MTSIIAKRILDLVFVVSFIPMLVSCGSTLGIADFQRYSEAFNLQYEAGNTVLDSVARAERIVTLRRIKKRGKIPDFRPDEAAYWVETVQPPITDSIRTSLGVLKSYNDALGALASGETAEALTVRLSNLVTQTATTVVSLGVAFNGTTAVPGSDKLIAGLTERVNVFAEIFKAIAVRASREQFRTELVAVAQDMEEFLLELRRSTPVMFQLMQRGRTTRGDLLNPGGVSPADLKELERERALLAGWVLLMDKTLIAMNAAVEAAQRDQTSELSVLAMTEAAIELRVVAEKVRSIRSKP